MGNRRISSRRIRSHLTYSVAEAADATVSHRNTVRHWLKNGLQSIDDRQPTIIKGSILKAFLDARKAKRRQPCGPGRLYCLKSRAPKRPVFGEVEYEADTPKLGRLIGMCPDCEGLIHRRASKRKSARRPQGEGSPGSASCRHNASERGGQAIAKKQSRDGACKQARTDHVEHPAE
jgi:hypothetical protein